MQLEEKVQENVARLLAMVCTDSTDPVSYEFVLEKLTRMAILGTKPAGSEPRKYVVPATVPETPAVGEASTSPGWTYKSEPTLDEDDFSAKKESFIAP